MTLIKKIISGGQTGVDRAALDVALELKIPHGGWCPKGRIASDGIIPSGYHLDETPTADYTQRTEWNVRDSDGTLIISFLPLSGGSAYTRECAKRMNKPFLIIDLKNEKPGEEVFVKWIGDHQIRCMNVAGPRETFPPKIYLLAHKILIRFIRQILS